MHATATRDARPAGQWQMVLLVLLAAFSGGAVVLLQRPVLDHEPLYAATNAAVTVFMVTVGGYLVLYRRERFTGLCFAAAGLSWPLIVLDAYPGWGPFLSFVLGAGSTFFVPIIWGVLRYGRPRLTHRTERWFLVYAAFFTSGVGAVFSLFSRPEWIGFPADAHWPALWPSPTAFAAAGTVLLLGFFSAAVLFAVLVLRLLREAPPIRRQAIRPLCFFGVVLGFGSTVAYGTATFTDSLLSYHQMAMLIGLLAIGLTAVLGLAMVRHDLLRARLLDRLPDALTPHQVTRYLREVVQDRTAELHFVDPGTGELLDADGHPGTPDREDRFQLWITGADGSRVALLSGDPLLANDSPTAESVRRMMSVLADNARLQVLLRMRVAQLTAARTAEQLAFEHARESFHRDLHDGIQQTIAAARMDLEGLLERPGLPELPEAGALATKLGRALEQVHALRAGAQPPELRFGLKAAVERTVAELRLVARCEITPADLGILTLPVYYLVREALTNAHKHARAGSVRVDVGLDGREIRLCVVDDGVGGAAGNGAGGIDGMRRRVEELGGRMSVDSPSGAGTAVRVRLPAVR